MHLCSKQGTNSKENSKNNKQKKTKEAKRKEKQRHQGHKPRGGRSDQVQERGLNGSLTYICNIYRYRRYTSTLLSPLTTLFFASLLGGRERETSNMRRRWMIFRRFSNAKEAQTRGPACACGCSYQYWFLFFLSA